MSNDFPLKCSHTASLPDKYGNQVFLGTMQWFPVDIRGDPMLIQQYKEGHGKPVRTWEPPIVSLTLCLDCGVTFSSDKPADKKKRTAATLRMLQRKVNKP